MIKWEEQNTVCTLVILFLAVAIWRKKRQKGLFKARVYTIEGLQPGRSLRLC